MEYYKMEQGTFTIILEKAEKDGIPYSITTKTIRSIGNILRESKQLFVKQVSTYIKSLTDLEDFDLEYESLVNFYKSSMVSVVDKLNVNESIFNMFIDLDETDDITYVYMSILGIPIKHELLTREHSKLIQDAVIKEVSRSKFTVLK